MAIVFDAASNNADASAGTSVTLSHTVGSGSNRVLTVGVYHDFTSSVTGVTYNGVACTQIFTQQANSDDATLDVWRLIAPATGTHNAVASFGSSVSFCQMGVASYNGVHQTTPFDTSDHYGPGSSEPFTRTITSATGDLVLDWAMTVSDGGTQNLAPGTGQTERWEAKRSGLYRDMASSEKAGAASVVMEYTDDAGTVYHSAYGAVNMNVASSGLSATVNQVTETDVAQAVAKRKLKAVGQITETDAAQAVTRRKLKAIGQITETDAAQTVTWNPKRRLIGQATETDSAQAITRRKLKAVGQTAETDVAQAITVRKTKAIGQVAETDLAQAIVSRKIVGVAQSTEVDQAQTITTTGQKVVAVDQAAETDVAQAITPRKTRAVGQVFETDLAQVVARGKLKAVGQVTETDLAQSVAWNPKRRLIGRAIEIDQVFDVVPVGGAPVVSSGYLIKRRRK